MAKLDLIKKFNKKIARNKKIAEIIWLSIGGIFFAFGIFCLIVNLIVMNIGSDTTNVYHAVGYGFVQFQNSYVNWWNSFSGWKITSFFDTGIVFTLVSAAYLLIVILIYASKQDSLLRKEKARKLRERNTQKFLEAQKAFEETKSQEAVIEAKGEEKVESVDSITPVKL